MRADFDSRVEYSRRGEPNLNPDIRDEHPRRGIWNVFRGRK